MKDTSGAGQYFADLPLLYQRTRQVLMAPHERPTYEFHWECIPPRTLQVLLILRSSPVRLSRDRLSDELESATVHVDRSVSYTSIRSCVNGKYVTSMLFEHI